MPRYLLICIALFVGLLVVIDAVGDAIWDFSDNMQIWWNCGGDDGE